jgi:hypothetical protein
VLSVISNCYILTTTRAKFGCSLSCKFTSLDQKMRLIIHCFDGRDTSCFINYEMWPEACQSSIMCIPYIKNRSFINWDGADSDRERRAHFFCSIFNLMWRIMWRILISLESCARVLIPYWIYQESIVH